MHNYSGNLLFFLKNPSIAYHVPFIDPVAIIGVWHLRQQISFGFHISAPEGDLLDKLGKSRYDELMRKKDGRFL
jgi:hypothetical protein